MLQVSLNVIDHLCYRMMERSKKESGGSRANMIDVSFVQESNDKKSEYIVFNDHLSLSI